MGALFKGPKMPKPTAEEMNLQRAQQDELAQQKSEISRRRVLLSQGGRRSMLSGGERGVS